MLPEKRADRASRPISGTGLQRAALVVGLGEAKVLKENRPDADGDRDDALVAFGLGSCVALCLWDRKARVAGMAHIVLPGEDPTGQPNPRFARSALPALVALMQAHGAARSPGHLVARLVGGAQVLALDAHGGLAPVGEANAVALQKALCTAGVSIVAHDLGGFMGRSVWFDPRDEGQVRVRAIGSSDRYL